MYAQFKKEQPKTAEKSLRNLNRLNVHITYNLMPSERETFVRFDQVLTLDLNFQIFSNTS